MIHSLDIAMDSTVISYNFGMAHGISVRFGFWMFHKLSKMQKMFDFIDFWMPYS